MSNTSAESPKTAIRRMMSTVETIQSLFPDLWVDADADPRESPSEGAARPDALTDSTWSRVQQPCTPVGSKQPSQSDVSWPWPRTTSATTPADSDGAMSRLMSTVATNQLLFPELWDPIDRVQRGELPDRFQVASGSVGIWSHNRQQHLRLSARQQTTSVSFARRENVDRSEDEDSSDSGIYSGTYLA